MGKKINWNKRNGKENKLEYEEWESKYIGISGMGKKINWNKRNGKGNELKYEEWERKWMRTDRMGNDGMGRIY